MFEVVKDHIHVLDPATSKLIGEFPIDSEAVLDQRFDRLEAAFKDWSGLTIRERGRYLLKLRSVIYARMENIAQVISDATGKPKVEALTAEVVPILDFISYFVKRAPRVLADQKIPLNMLKYKRSFLRFEPFGVIAILSPWNFPFSLPMGDIILALLAGNTVIVKTSEAVLPVAKVIEDIFRDAGVSKGVVEVAYGDGKTGSYIVSSPRVKKIVFTGSTSVGRKILEQAAKNLTPCVLELGGKDAAIVRKDANLKKAAKGIVWGAFANAGQICASIERVYVAREVAQSFSELVVSEMSQLKLRDEVGAVTIPSQIDRYMRQLEGAVRGGAKILMGGMRETKLEGHFFQPTAIINTKQNMDIMQEETFGPLLPIMMVDSDDEAIRLTNDSSYGLGASIWTRDVKRGIDMATRIQSGTVTINDAVFTAALPEVPWGGYKQSGIGRVHSDIGLKAFTEVKHINYDLISLKPFWWFPYTKNSYETSLALAGVVAAPRLRDRFISAVKFLRCYFSS